mgnify:CR=1 FL=1
MNGYECEVTRAEMDVIAERAYQRTKWPDENDNSYGEDQLIFTAINLIMPLNNVSVGRHRLTFHEAIKANNPERRQQLVIAAALIIAELDRLDRIEDALLS